MNDDASGRGAKERSWSTTLSMRTLLLAVALSASTCFVYARPDDFGGQLGAMIEVGGLMVLLLVVCVTFASAADDVWQDPSSAFVGGLFGVLGFVAIIVLGMLLPMTI